MNNIATAWRKSPRRHAVPTSPPHFGKFEHLKSDHHKVTTLHRVLCVTLPLPAGFPVETDGLRDSADLEAPQLSLSLIVISQRELQFCHI